MGRGMLGGEAAATISNLSCVAKIGYPLIFAKLYQRTVRTARIIQYPTQPLPPIHSSVWLLAWQTSGGMSVPGSPCKKQPSFTT